MHRVDVRVLQHLLEVRVADIHAKGIADVFQLLRITLADGIADRLRMTLPDRDELRPESEADDGDVELLFRHGGGR